MNAVAPSPSMRHNLLEDPLEESEFFSKWQNFGNIGDLELFIGLQKLLSSLIIF